MYPCNKVTIPASWYKLQIVTRGPLLSDDFKADIGSIARIMAVPKILQIICRMTGMGFAAVARVTGERWIACAVKDEIAFGLQPGDELKVETTICHEIHGHRQPVVINHVTQDPNYNGHPTPALYGFESYISVPIVLPDGTFFGTLCAIDPRPAQVNTPGIIGTFELFADLISLNLSSMDRETVSEAALSNERKTSALREQFIAVLGHDLRNPLGAINSGMQIIERTPLDETASLVVDMMRKSVMRMADLIDNILDFARGRLGGGIALERDTYQPLKSILLQVIAELRLSFPDRILEDRFDLTTPINCDRGRIGQLFSNLLGNAIAYGDTGMPIRASATDAEGIFELSVANSGEPIPPAALERLFQPFTRGEIQPHHQGLGLGLYICAEIARAHGGQLDVTSSTEETRFTFRMPLV